MTTSLLRWLAIMLITAVTAHAAMVFAAPYVIMSAAMQRIAGQAGTNAWAFAPRITPETQAVVRSSPDLAYAACAFDLTEGPVRIRVAGSPDYASLSLYADDTDNFFTINDRQMAAEGVEIALVKRGGAPPPGAARVVESPSVRGLALDRRLAPTEAAFARADAARRAANVCAPWSRGSE